MKRTLDKLSVTLGKVLAARGLQGGLQEYRIARAWPAAVGSVIAKHAQPGRFKSGKLTLVVDSPAWMQQLVLIKPEIIGKLNDRLAAKLVRDILLTIGDVGEPPGGGHEGEEQQAAALSADEQELIRNSVSTISDESVRAALQRVFEKDRLRKKTAKN